MDDQRIDAKASSGRRDFLRRATRVAGATALAPSLQGLVACATAPGAPGTRGAPAPRRAGPGEGGYGPIQPAGAELALPTGFAYTVLSTAGKPMSDGTATPNAFDGMAAFAMPNGNVRLIRNHENRDHPLSARVKGDPARAYDPRGGGGCTSLEVR